MSKRNAKAADLADVNKKSKKNIIFHTNKEIMHPLELKYGKEPPLKIKEEDRWRWH